ncbi:hypothetical protein [Secundilactobacillus similis]|nr:hypothetical protein [Secundilactobacillus similis]
MKHFEIKAILGLGAVLVGVGFLGTLTVEASTASSLDQAFKDGYVKTKKAMYTGQYTIVNGKKSKKVITPKGTILQVGGSGADKQSDGSYKYTINLDRGDLNHTQAVKYYETGRAITYKTSELTPYKLKVPVRTRLLQAGTDFDPLNTKMDYQPIFHLTLNGYLEYYSAARLKHYQIPNTYQLTKLENLPGGNSTTYTPKYLAQIKPTASEKVSTFKVKGDTTYLYYKKPINGLTEKKVSNRYYRLIIKQTTSMKEKTWISGEDYVTVQWMLYNVGGHSFRYINSYEGGD